MTRTVYKMSSETGNSATAPPGGGNNMEARITKLELIAENTAKTLDAIRSDMKDFRAESRSDTKDFRAESRSDMKELRADMRDLRNDSNSNFKWVVGIQVTTL